MDFKFAHPSADITGLIRVIESLTDFARINHGLRPKFKDSLPSSGFALLMDKIGVMEDNIRRAKLFKEREQQLFQVIKTLWNMHNSKSGNKRFSDKARLMITYKQPEFPVDPKTKMDALQMENILLNSGDRRTVKKLYPHLSDSDIELLLKERNKDKITQGKADAQVLVEKAKVFEKAGLDPTLALGKGGKPAAHAGDADKAPKSADNRAKHAEESSKKDGHPTK